LVLLALVSTFLPIILYDKAVTSGEVIFIERVDIRHKL